jgi:GT2 family glycosyltransferase
MGAEEMISIILNTYSPSKWQRHMDMACLAAIRKFTDPEYEIIVVDNEPKFPIRDDYGVLEPYKLIVNKKNRNVYQSYNQGAKEARGEYLVFIQNDVFCNERTINKLCEYLKVFDVAYPQQIELSREKIKEIYATEDGELTSGGWRDAGMLAITREAFDKTGGWDERYHNLLGEKAFYSRIDEMGLSWISQTNAIITHIMAANNLSKPDELYKKEMEHDAKIN